MKVLMIGTPGCTRCKAIAPTIEEYCSSHSVQYQYKDISEIDTTVGKILVASKVKSAPVFLIYTETVETPVVVSGDEVFTELEKIN